MTKVLPPLNKHKLSKKSKEKDDEIKRKLYTANSNWNNWELRLHWNKLEWVNPKGKIKIKEPYSVSSKKYYIDKDDRTDYWVGH